ncbi:MAG: sulfatase [Spartobacteria bacterium]
MNVIVILLDSLNFDCLEPYGATQVRTPNMKRFAERAVTFDNHFITSAPCMPARRDLLTGRAEFLWRGWGHVEPWDRHIAADAEKAGYVTQMVTDHYHYWENEAHGYFEPFQGVEFVRGHELDAWDTTPLGTLPEWVRSIDRYRPKHWQRPAGWGGVFYGNARHYEHDEALFPCAQVMQKSADWLDRNHARQKFFLWSEAFDPHEPHFLPERYRTMYSADGKDHPEFTCWPPYQNHAELRRFLAEASDAELDWVRAQYHGKVTMVDHWLGRVFDRLDALDLWKDTCVILTTDHGHELCADRSLMSPYAKSYPHREAHSRIPLMIYHPQATGGRRVSALTNALDVNATLRELTGESAPGSLLPLVRGEAGTHREQVIFGDFGTGVCLATDDWILAQGCRSDRPLNWYSTTGLRVSPDMVAGHFIPGVDIAQWRVPMKGPDLPSFLWRRQPFSPVPENLLELEPKIVAGLRDRLRTTLAKEGPPELPARLNL